MTAAGGAKVAASSSVASRTTLSDPAEPNVAVEAASCAARSSTKFAGGALGVSFGSAVV